MCRFMRLTKEQAAAVLVFCLSIVTASSAQSPSSPKPAANDQLLAKAAHLYYSATAGGLERFSCAVHPEWRDFLASADKAPSIPAGDPRVAILNGVGIHLEASVGGSSDVEWKAPDSPAAQTPDSTRLLGNMQKAVTQTLEGFVQFWAPFINGSMIPDSADGLDVSKTATGYTIHGAQGQTTTTEFLDTSLNLHEFDLGMNDLTIKFVPQYKPTPQGLLVSSFVTQMTPAAGSTHQPQEMHVSLGYQTVTGFPLPANIAVEVVNTGNFHFAFEGCTVKRAAQ